MDDNPVRGAFVKRLTLAMVVIVGIGAIVYFGPRDAASFWEAAAAAALGALVAIAELVTRYRDDPAAALISVPAIIYIGVNASAALAAFHLILSFGWTFGATGDSVDLVQVLTAGFGSAALFRSSFFNVTAGDQVVGIGPSAVLNVILTAADRAVDRQRAVIRSAHAGKVMRGISFERSADSIVAFTVATMQNVSADEAQAIQNRVAQLRDRKNDDIPDVMKSYILGMSLLTLTGRKVLEGVADRVRDAFPAPELGGPAVPATTDSPDKAEDVPAKPDVKILETLRNAGVPVPIQDLQRELGVDFRSVSRSLKSLRERDLVHIEGRGFN